MHICHSWSHYNIDFNSSATFFEVCHTTNSAHEIFKISLGGSDQNLIVLGYWFPAEFYSWLSLARFFFYKLSYNILNWNVMESVNYFFYFIAWVVSDVTGYLLPCKSNNRKLVYIKWKPKIKGINHYYIILILSYHFDYCSLKFENMKLT